MLAVFQKAIRDSRKTILWLGIGLGLYMVMVISFYPSMLEQSESMNELLESYPEGLIAAMYGQSEGEIDIAEPGGFVHSQFAIWVMLILGALIAYQAFNAFTNAERDGTLDILLSLPLSRREVLLGRMLSTLVFSLLILTVSFVALVGSRALFPEFEVSLPDMALMMYGMLPLLLVVTAFCYMLTTLVPSRMRYAGALAYFFIIGSYLLYSFSLGIESLKDLQPYFIYDYYNAGTLLRQGINWTDWLILGVVFTIFMSITWWAVEHKELGV